MAAACFGRSFLTGTSGDYYSFKTTISGFGATKVQGAVNALPELAGTGGSPSRTVPYGASATGSFAVGMDYLGVEKAVLWNTHDPNPANWYAIDLTVLAQQSGIMDGWVRLSRAYSVGEDPGKRRTQSLRAVGVWSPDGGTTTFTRAFVMEIPEPSTAVLAGLGMCALLVFRRRK